MSNDSNEALAADARAPARLLLVDDQPELRRLFRRTFQRVGYDVVEAPDGRVAVELVQRLAFDLVISDVRMPDMTGIELLRIVHGLDADLPFVLTSGSPDALSSLEAQELGAFAYLVKPVPFELMRETALRAVDLRRARAALGLAGFEPYASVARLKVRG